MTLSRPLIICLSGKRFSGKTNVSKIIKSQFEHANFKVAVKSLSFYCKQAYCTKSGADINLMLDDHAYKNSHRDALTEYFLSTDPLIYVKLLESDIETETFDVYIIDDMRLLVENAQYFKENWASKWNLVYVRVSATDETKIGRGWTRSLYDNEPCENELDDYKEFDYVVENNGTIQELHTVVTTIVHNVFDNILVLI